MDLPDKPVRKAIRNPKAACRHVRERIEIQNPRLFARAINRKFYTRFGMWEYNRQGVDIFEEEWDNLIILDACRLDLFEEVWDSRGQLNQKISRGANTVEWLKANVRGRTLHNTVYITGNGQIHHQREQIQPDFHDVIPIFAFGWNESSGTVNPEAVTREAIKAASEYPHKRLLIHYVQPHFPFIGADTEVDERPPGKRHYPFWERVFTGKYNISRQKLWNAYQQTLEITIPYVEELVKELDGRTVISSDHGNMFGERPRPIPIREWGHPPGIYTRELVRVPWFVINDERRRVHSDEPKTWYGDLDRVSTESKLKNLGYLS
ncbi:hypothetical protein [Haloarcula litorea]|uniref:hypothetical protein n=1 Tax=Haloarcula litorea TaxID=3032579 RepID=UPI0023E888A3|nr:hypothetical protein [Halomicroarcula sp. GDY20]